MKFRVVFKQGAPSSQIITDIVSVEIVDGILILLDKQGTSWEFGLDCLHALAQLDEETHEE